MKERFRRFMAGRYGSDQLSRFLMASGLALMVLFIITRRQIFYTLLLIILLYNLFRTFSRNVRARYDENMKYVQLREQVRTKVKGFLPAKTDAEHRIYRCPGCSQKVRVPRGRGRIAITCPKCRKEFIRKT